MNLLTDTLPDSVEIDGKAHRIRTGLSAWVRFELLMQKRGGDPGEKFAEAMTLCYPEPPGNLSAALERLLWFYRCGMTEEEQTEATAAKEAAKRPKKSYCFEQDMDLFFSSFWACYQIDLNAKQDMHWWKFRSLFRGLPSESELAKVIHYRTADTKGLSKSEKKRYEKLRKLYALKNTGGVEAVISLAERNQRMKDYVAKRFAEMEGVAEKESPLQK